MKNLFLKEFNKILYLARLLSFDVSLGAIASCLLYLNALNQEVSVSNLVSLGATVWLIYNFDHLSDSKKIDHRVLRRRKFYNKNFRMLSTVWCLMLCLNAVYTIVNLSYFTLCLGISLMFLVIIYFYILNSLTEKATIIAVKEISIAMIYSIGLGIPSIQTFKAVADPSFLLVLAQVFMLGLINLLEFSFFELNEDVLENQPSLVRVIGNKATKKLIWTLIVITYSIIITIMFSRQASHLLKVEVCIFAMNTLLMTVFWKKEFFKVKERYRIWGDSVFLIPLILLLDKVSKF